MNSSRYSALWVRFDAESSSIEMACDNENNTDEENWQAPFANCIAIQERFYCACYALEPHVAGFQLNARICELSQIPVNSARDVAKLFILAMGLGAALQGESVFNWTAAEREARLYIWDKHERILSGSCVDHVENLDSGTYTAGFSTITETINIAALDSYSFFEELRKRLNHTGQWHLDGWPDIRSKFSYSGDDQWIHQWFASRNIAEEIVEALAPIIRNHLS